MNEEKVDLPRVQLDRGAALAYSCTNKVEPMDLGNHRAAYNCLRKLGGDYKKALQSMGYGCVRKNKNKNYIKS